MMLILMLKFCAKESSNLIGLENVEVAGFSFTAGLGWCSPYQSKSDQISTRQSPTTTTPTPHFYIRQIFTLLLLEVGD